MGTLIGLEPQIPISELGLPESIERRVQRQGISDLAGLISRLNDPLTPYIRGVGEKSEEIIREAIRSYYERRDHHDSTPQLQSGAQGSDKNLISKLGLPIKVERSLLRADIQTIGNLTRALADGSIREVRNLGEKGCQAIHKALEIYTSNLAGNSILQVTGQNVHSTWASAFESFYFEESKRDIHILLKRFGTDRQRPGQIASDLKLTKKRVYQIQKRICQKYLFYITRSCEITFVNRFDRIISTLGENLSIGALERMLDKDSLLGCFTETLTDWKGEPIRVCESFACFLGVIEKLDLSISPVSVKVRMKTLREAGTASIGTLEALKAIDPGAIRKVLRKVLFTGGIGLVEASEILRLTEDATRHELERLGLEPIISGWFSFTHLDRHSLKSPLRNAGLKMLSACPCMSLDAFCDGLLHHISCSYPSLASRQVLIHFLRLLEFEISDGQVTTYVPCMGALSKPERCFVDLVAKLGGIVKYAEVVEYFHAQGLSRPSATIMLKTSPIVEKVETGLYKIRGMG